MRGQKHRVAGSEGHLALVFDQQSGGAGQHHHPLILVLIVPRALWRDLAVGDNSLQPDARPLGQGLEHFFGRGIWQVGQQVAWHGVVISCLCLGRGRAQRVGRERQGRQKGEERPARDRSVNKLGLALRGGLPIVGSLRHGITARNTASQSSIGVS